MRGMGRYIAFHFDVTKASSWAAGFEPSFRSEFFRPIELTASSFNRKRPPMKFGSPNPRLDSEFLLTKADGPSLSSSDLRECEKWVEDCSGASIDLDGAVDLCDPDHPELPLHDCYEFAGVSSIGEIVIGGPFLHLHCVTPDDGQDKARIRVYAMSTVWVRYGESVERCWHSLGGHISPRLADEYLLRLVKFCRLLLEPNVDRIQYSALGIGDNFRMHDGERVSAAFELGLSGLGLKWDVD
jgi:hypothetical protein